MAKRGGKGGKKEGTTIVIRRVEEVAAGHHGGAWKVAYADFVTAMMAFFLLMWLLNATTEQQRRGIAAYFSPLANVENGFSGQGLVPGGVSPLDKGTSLVNKGTGTPPAPTPPQTVQGAAGQVAAGQTADDDDGTPVIPDTDDDDQPSGQSKEQTQAAGKDAAGPSDAGAARSAAIRAAKAMAEQASLTNAADQIRRLVAADPSLATIAGQMAIDVTPEGLRIQIMDSEGKPMFDRGAATLNARAAALLSKVAPFLATLPEPVSIGGYTDAAPWAPGTATNWTLSSGRANAARDLLVGSGLPDTRITDVTGFADRHLLLPADPLSSANRRVVLTLRRRYPTPAAGPVAPAQSANTQPAPAQPAPAQPAPAQSAPAQPANAVSATASGLAKPSAPAASAPAASPGG